MKRACLVTIAFFSMASTFAQTAIDTLVEKLQDRNLNVLNEQLYQCVDNKLYAKINPDMNSWNELRLAVVQKILDKSKTFGADGQVIVSAHLAEVMVRAGKIDLSYSLIKEALAKANTRPGLAKAYAYSKFSDIFGTLNKVDSAIFYAEKEVDLAREIANDSIEKRALDQVAMLCFKAKDNFKAEYFFKRLINHPLTEQGQRRNYYNTIALIHQKRKSYDTAIYYFNKALTLVKPNDLAWIGLLNGNIGYTLFLQGKKEQALPGLLMDLEFSSKSNSKTSALYALNSIISTYSVLGRMKQAQFYYDSLAKTVAAGVDVYLQLEFYKTSAEYFKHKGDLPKSLGFLQSFIKLQDSITNMENTEKATELSAQFEFDRQVKKIETLESQSLQQAAENRQKNYLLLGTLAIIVLGSGLIYVQFRSNRFKHETNRMLKEQNIQIRLQAESLNQLNKTKDKIFSIIGHDLRGPINSLKGLLSMVSNEMVTQEEFQQFSSNLHNNVEYVHFTLDNLLLWSKSQLHGIQPRQQSVALSVLVDENINLLCEAARAKKIDLVNNVQPGAQVNADPDQIRLVLRNLVSNAIKFTNPDGHVTIECHSDGDKEIVSVSDNGMGMTSARKENLFENQSNQSTPGTEGEKGTGLGLSLCKEMIEMNGGSIWVESEHGKGTSIRFSLTKA